MSELLNCPFCGNEVEMTGMPDGFGKDMYTIFCRTFGCAVFQCHDHLNSELITRETWNRRASQPALSKERAELIADLRLLANEQDPGKPRWRSRDLINKAADALAEGQPSGWVSVKERLPEEGQTVLIFYPLGSDPYNQQKIIMYIHGQWVAGAALVTPTHWHVLPDPPSGQEPER